MATQHTLALTLQQLLKARGYNSHSLAMASGIPQPVIHRIARRGWTLSGTPEKP